MKKKSISINKISNKFLLKKLSKKILFQIPKLISYIIAIIAGSAFVVYAATTTIGEDITTTNLTVSGNATTTGNQIISGNLTVSGNATTTGAFNVSGNTTLATTTLSGYLDMGLKEMKNVVLEKLATTPSSPAEGQMYWDTASSSPFWYDATNSRWNSAFSSPENSKVVTVCATGCNYATIADALTWVGTQTTYDTVDIGSLTVDIVQYSNEAVFSGTIVDIIRPGDLLYLDDDAAPVYGVYGSYSEHWYPIIDVGGQGSTNYSLILATALAGSAKSNYTPVVYRPRKYVIQLLPGDHILGNPQIPNGVDISIVGMGKASIIYGDPNNIGSTGMYAQRYGYTTLSNLYGSSTSIIKASNNIKSYPNIGEGFSFLTISDLQISSEGSPFNGMTLAGLVAHNIVVEAAADHCYIPVADYVMVDGWTSRIDESTEAIIIAVPSTRPVSSHRKTFKNITAYRYPSNPYRDGQDQAVTISVGDTFGGDVVIDITNFVIIDYIGSLTDTFYNLEVLAPQGNTGTGDNLIVNIIGGMFQFTDSDHKEHISTSGSRYQLNLRDVKDENGKQVTVKSGEGSNIRWLDADATGNIAYASTVTPNLYDGHRQIIGELTEDITIGAPTGDLVVGEKLTLVFTQDSTGSRTITWNSVFKADTNGAGAANEKGSTSFVYDGTHWVQEGGALTFK